MKGFVAAIAIFIAVIVVVSSTSCHHGDMSMCEVMCIDATKEPGCEHDVCTCVDKPGMTQPGLTCLSPTDCSGVTCDHPDETAHCFDNFCLCRKH